MRGAIAAYWESLTVAFGDAWNRFWFTPREPTTLAVIRWLTGLMAIYVHATYSMDLVRWFGPDGMFPVEVVEQLAGPQRVRFSYLDYLQSPGELYVAHATALVILALFTIGFYTRITALLALVVTVSYMHRAPMVTGELEPVLAMVLFYICLGPSGACLSVDRALARRNAPLELAIPSGEPQPAGRSVTANLAIRLMQVHLCVIYLMMGVSKLAEPDDTWWQGDAVWWLIAKPDSRLVDLTWLHDHLYLVNGWTHAIVLFELAFAMFIWHSLARPLLLALSVLMWGTLALVSGLVPFCLMMLIASLCFVPPETMQAFLTTLRCGLTKRVESEKTTSLGPRNA